MYENRSPRLLRRSSLAIADADYLYLDVEQIEFVENGEPEMTFHAANLEGAMELKIRLYKSAPKSAGQQKTKVHVEVRGDEPGGSRRYSQYVSWIDERAGERGRE